MLAPVLLSLTLAHATGSDALGLDLEHSQTGGVITNPLGLFIRHDIGVDTGLLPALFGDGFVGDVRAGAFTQWLVYSTELGLRASWLTKPELLVLSVEGAFEPGSFVENGPGVGPGLDEYKRVAHTRSRFTAQALVNLKLEQWWLYSRSTASVKLRDFVEYDPYQDVVVKDQLDLEQATALFWRLYALRSFSSADRKLWPSQMWIYTEYTVGMLSDLATGPRDARPHRVSVGLVAENWPLRGAGVNLDVYWSFANQPAPGPGTIALYGIVF